MSCLISSVLQQTFIRLLMPDCVFYLNCTHCIYSVTFMHALCSRLWLKWSLTILWNTSLIGWNTTIYCTFIVKNVMYIVQTLYAPVACSSRSSQKSPSLHSLLPTLCVTFRRYFWVDHQIIFVIESNIIVSSFATAALLHSGLGGQTSVVLNSVPFGSRIRFCLSRKTFGITSFSKLSHNLIVFKTIIKLPTAFEETPKSFKTEEKNISVKIWLLKAKRQSVDAEKDFLKPMKWKIASITSEKRQIFAEL